MLTFEYKALTAEGAFERGTLAALDRAGAVRALAHKGIFPTHLVEASPGAGTAFFGVAWRVRRASVKEVASFTRNLGTLVSSGVPLLRALAVARQHDEGTALGDVIASVIDEVRAGDSLSGALAGHERLFNRLYVSVVRAGETAGVLGETLKQLASFLEREARLRSDVVTAMLYPVFVLSLAVVFIGIIMGAILPRILAEVSSLTTVLPWPTEVLMACTSIVGRYWPVLLIAVAALVIFVRRVGRTQRGRRRMDSLKLALPVVGPALRRVAIGRFARTLGVLARNGVPILEALAIAGDTAGNEHISHAVRNAAASVKGGESLADQLEKTAEFPALLVNMIALGEETGRLDVVLLEAAEAYDQEVSTAIARLNALLPPVLILIVGAIIGFAVAAVILPIVQAQAGISLH